MKSVVCFLGHSFYSDFKHSILILLVIRITQIDVPSFPEFLWGYDNHQAMERS